MNPREAMKITKGCPPRFVWTDLPERLKAEPELAGQLDKLFPLEYTLLHSKLIP